MRSYRAWAAGVASVAAAGAATAGIIFLFEYYRWPGAPTTDCDPAGDAAEIHLATQPREWFAIDPDDGAVNHYLVNGVDGPSGFFDIPDGTGSLTYPGFTHPADGFPFHFVFRLETVSDSQPVYQSALAATCTGPGTTTSVVVNWVPGQAARYYRWDFAPAVTCETQASNVRLRFASQPIEWVDPPGTAEVGIVYLENGAETPTGPFPLPSEEGSQIFGALSTSSATYPLHYAVRLDTKVGSNVVYQSVLLGSCTADGAGTSHVYHVPEPGETALALVAIAALALRARRRSRA